MLNKKLITLGSMVTAAIPLAALSCNMSVGYKITLFNYQDYISEDAKASISQTYNYKEFGDLPELEQALNSGKTIGGVGSDYYNAKLAKQRVIKKIDFHKMLHIDYANVTELGTKLQTIYTTDAWNQMKSFDAYLGDADGDGTPDKLFEYMVPYFMQNKVIAFSVTRPQANWTPAEKAKLDDPTQINSLFADRSYIGIMKTLRSHGYNKLIINDYMRDNLMIGSEKLGHFTGNLTEVNFESQVNAFKQSILEGWGYPTSNSEHIKYESSGMESLSGIIDAEKKWDTAFIYNGDALDAYYGADNEVGAADESIRVVVPTNPVFLLDGLVLSSAVSQQAEDEFYRATYNSFYEGYDATDIEDHMIFNNFDYVNYTTPFKKLYDYLVGTGNYFDGDASAEHIFTIANGNDAEHAAQPIDNLLQAKVNAYYEENKY